jgi:hypothetical protein
LSNFCSARAEVVVLRIGDALGRLKPLSFRDNVGQQGHESGAQNCMPDSSLILGAVAGFAASDQIAIAIDHDLQCAKILVIDEYRTWAAFFGTETALQLPLDASSLALVRTLRLLVIEFEWTNHAATTLCVLFCFVVTCIVSTFSDNQYWPRAKYSPGNRRLWQV